MRVLVAMSGGVDSSVAAARLRDDGHEVVGVTMRLWGGPSDTGCCSVSEVSDARRAAAQLGIDHHVFDFSAEFERHVVEPYVADHVAGRTPNPCVECNRHLKFDALLHRADVLGFDAGATGHHARIVDVDGALRVGRGADRAKDQSYVLHPIADADLRRVLLPIGDMTKDRVRAEAARLGLRTATKPDSQDVCFITRSEGRAAFLRERMELHPGQVVDLDGRAVGHAEAVELVTIGQRKGLGLAGGADRRFVLDVDVATATVTVGPPERLLVEELALGDVRWAARTSPAEAVGLDVAVQCSAHGRVDTAVVEAASAERVALRWHEPRRRVAAGQSVVLYDHTGDDATVLAGGVAS